MDALDYFNVLTEPDFKGKLSGELKACFRSMTFTWYTILKIYGHASKKCELMPFTRDGREKQMARSNAFWDLTNRIASFSKDLEITAKTFLDQLSVDVENEPNHFPGLIGFIDEAVRERNSSVKTEIPVYKKSSNDFMKQYNSIGLILESLTDISAQKVKTREKYFDNLESQKQIKTVHHVNGKIKYKGHMLPGSSVPHGQGFLNHYNGNLKYRGLFDNGEIHTEYADIFHFNGNLRYAGLVNGGKYQGQGKLYHENGCLKYKGEFSDDKPDGDCLLFHENGNIEYRGTMKDGFYNGQGALFHMNGNLEYEGDFRAGGPDGQLCHVYYDNGVVKYRGSMEGGHFDGYGTLKNRREYVEYQGMFKEGLPIDQNEKPIDLKASKSTKRMFASENPEPATKKLDIGAYSSVTRVNRSDKATIEAREAEVERNDGVPSVYAKENEFDYRFDPTTGRDKYPDGETFYDHVLTLYTRKTGHDSAESEINESEYLDNADSESAFESNFRSGPAISKSAKKKQPKAMKASKGSHKKNTKSMGNFLPAHVEEGSQGSDEDEAPETKGNNGVQIKRNTIGIFSDNKKYGRAGIKAPSLKIVKTDALEKPKKKGRKKPVEAPTTTGKKIAKTTVIADSKPKASVIKAEKKDALKAGTVEPGNNNPNEHKFSYNAAGEFDEDGCYDKDHNYNPSAKNFCYDEHGRYSQTGVYDKDGVKNDKAHKYCYNDQGNYDPNGCYDIDRNYDPNSHRHCYDAQGNYDPDGCYDRDLNFDPEAHKFNFDADGGYDPNGCYDRDGNFDPDSHDPQSPVKTIKELTSDYGAGPGIDPVIEKPGKKGIGNILSKVANMIAIKPASKQDRYGNPPAGAVKDMGAAVGGKAGHINLECFIVPKQIPVDNEKNSEVKVWLTLGDIQFKTDLSLSTTKSCSFQRLKGNEKLHIKVFAGKNSDLSKTVLLKDILVDRSSKKVFVLSELSPTLTGLVEIRFKVFFFLLILILETTDPANPENTRAYIQKNQRSISQVIFPFNKTLALRIE